MKKPASKADRAARISRAADRAAEVIDAATRVETQPAAVPIPARTAPAPSGEAFLAAEVRGLGDAICGATAIVARNVEQSSLQAAHLDHLSARLTELAGIVEDLRRGSRIGRHNAMQAQARTVGAAPVPATPEAANAALPVGSGAAPAKGH